VVGGFRVLWACCLLVAVLCLPASYQITDVESSVDAETHCVLLVVGETGR